jgi:hypothetical protein
MKIIRQVHLWCNLETPCNSELQYVTTDSR